MRRFKLLPIPALRLVEFDPAFASDLGLTARELKINGWPLSIDTNAGNKMPFQFGYHVEADGDVVAVVYRQQLGCISLRIFND